MIDSVELQAFIKAAKAELKKLNKEGSFMSFSSLRDYEAYLVAGAKLHKKLEKIPDKWFI